MCRIKMLFSANVYHHSFQLSGKNKEKDEELTVLAEMRIKT
ncbi:hypothetical protein A33Q_0311 [Indibacter alkaliphilus LW1]|uniref:Uncharacterized protein n=1 Tax=Indibacter alkaliphilus (strain CCUG 57479 / KCTC 22604 / LW1) TaxID=1189612 RepID=S2DQV6_INDAL|nr:hypothetical protein A33Q_0311 [Indibacter alkaliphilus LW1]